MRSGNFKRSGKCHINVCACTFQRTHLLQRLLLQLDAQKTECLFSYSVIIVDNDPSKSAETVISSLSDQVSSKVHYYHEPERSISLARNRCIREANGDFIAFIDDDEVPEKDWLLRLYQVLSSSDADGVLGPVMPLVDEHIPKWLLKSELLERRRFPTFHRILSARDTRTGNVLLRKELFYDLDTPFDSRYGRSGGGDVEFFQRMMLRGKIFLWCDEAMVYEHVLPERRRPIYYLKRAFSRGVTNAWQSPFFSVGTLKSFVAVPAYFCVLPFLAVVEQGSFMKYLVKCCDHLGKLLCYMGVQVVKERPYQ